jgi:hypothetical protein
MLTYLLWSARDGHETRGDWLAAVVMDAIVSFWIVFVTSAAVRVFFNG